MSTDQHVTCDGCGKEIDPDCCGCGGSKEGHGNVINEGHPFIPMGCDCFRVDNDVLDDEDYSICKHGVGFDEDCEDCDEEDYEEHMSRFGMLPP